MAPAAGEHGSRPGFHRRQPRTTNDNCPPRHLVTIRTLPRAAGPDRITRSFDRLAIQILPGVALCVLIAAAGYALQQLELAASGRAWIESMVLAILVGAAL